MVNCTGIYGDVNGDGIVNIVDALYVAQYLEGTRTLTPCQLIAADVDGDGIITATDRQYIANYSILTEPYGRCGQSFNITATCIGLYGDLNEDSFINSTDALFVAQYLEGTRTLTPCQLIAADVDGDGIITATDRQYIANYSVLTPPYGKCGQILIITITCTQPTCTLTLS